MTTTTAPKTTKAQRAEANRHEARVTLRDYLRPGTTVHTALRHVSKSGMVRHITVHLVTAEREVINITGLVARATDFRQTSDGMLKVQGCGMDMGFHVVYSLSWALYPNGHPCVGYSAESRTSCPSNDHSNDPGQARRDFYDHELTQGRERLLRGEDGYSEQRDRMRVYVDHRLATDLGHRPTRVHSDGGYALRHRWL